MAVLKGVLTGIKGKVGNLVYSVSNGKQNVRTSSIPTVRRTPNQIKIRNLFQNLYSMLLQLKKPVVNRFWNPFTLQGETGWSNLIKINLNLQEGPEIDYSKIVIARGSLPSEIINSISYYSNSGFILFHWTDSHSSGSHISDIVRAHVYLPSFNKWFTHSFSFVRSSRMCFFKIPKFIPLRYIKPYLFFYSTSLKTGKIVSVSNSTFKSLP